MNDVPTALSSFAFWVTTFVGVLTIVILTWKIASWRLKNSNGYVKHFAFNKLEKKVDKIDDKLDTQSMNVSKIMGLLEGLKSPGSSITP